MDGDHQLRQTSEPVVSEEQHKMMATQDKKYVLFRLSKELKKIEKLKKTLHLIDSSEKKNTHTIFVDNEDEAASFNVAKFFDTHPAFLDRTFNRPTLETLKKERFSIDPDELQAAMESKNAAYKELSKRIDRAKELKVIAEKLDAKLLGMDKKHRKKKVASETKESAAQYKFAFQRQK
ncbi:U3 small nucleolar RNA-associated protein 11 [Elysia marginata]|uniref:Probable U3 small nucleolar RNA-associated protein 11 n=1 Tax=Elysia marginata TaxID=1093978 RepID=A0AAV4HM31_9GAST|nr:U3 small nucleolar RNA-associated protein 11 [Elysia marginata]